MLKANEATPKINDTKLNQNFTSYLHTDIVSMLDCRWRRKKHLASHRVSTKQQSGRKKTDLRALSRSILGRWQSPSSSARTSNLGLCLGSEVSSLRRHAAALRPMSPSLRGEKGRWQFCSVRWVCTWQSVEWENNKGGERASEVIDKDWDPTSLQWQCLGK